MGHPERDRTRKGQSEVTEDVLALVSALAGLIAGIFGGIRIERRRSTNSTSTRHNSGIVGTAGRDLSQVGGDVRQNETNLNLTFSKQSAVPAESGVGRAYLQVSDSTDEDTGVRWISITNTGTESAEDVRWAALSRTGKVQLESAGYDELAPGNTTRIVRHSPNLGSVVVSYVCLINGDPRTKSFNWNA